MKQLNDKNKKLNEKYIKLKEENELITQKLINISYFNNNNINNNINNFENTNINLESARRFIYSKISNLNNKNLQIKIENQKNLK